MTAPLVVAGVEIGEQLISSWLSSNPALTSNEQSQLAALVTQITADPNLKGTPAQQAWIQLQCWAGNQNVLATYKQMTGDPAPAGCGYANSGGRQAAANLVTELVKEYPQLGTTGAGFTETGATALPVVGPSIASLEATTGLSGTVLAALLLVAGALWYFSSSGP